MAAILDSIPVIYCHLAKRLKSLRKLRPPHSPAEHESTGTAARRTPWPNPTAITGLDVNLHAENGWHYSTSPVGKHQLYYLNLYHECFAIIFECQHLSLIHHSIYICRSFQFPLLSPQAFKQQKGFTFLFKITMLADVWKMLKYAKVPLGWVREDLLRISYSYL